MNPDPQHRPSPRPPKASFAISTRMVIVVIGIVVMVVALWTTAIVMQMRRPMAIASNNPTSPNYSPTPSLVTYSPTPTPTPTPASTPAPVGSNKHRVDLAAEIRQSLHDEGIPAHVKAAGTKLTIHYQSALIDYAPSTFMRQQGGSGMRDIMDAGFETLVISAEDADGNRKYEEFPVANLQSK